LSVVRNQSFQRPEVSSLEAIAEVLDRVIEFSVVVVSIAITGVIVVVNVDDARIPAPIAAIVIDVNVIAAQITGKE